MILLVLQILTHNLKTENDSYCFCTLIIQARNSEGFHDWLLGQFSPNMQITGSRISRNNDHTITYHLTVRALKEMELSWLLDIMDKKDDILSVSQHTED